MKVAVITPIPTPYRDAYWNHFSQHPDISLHVVYCAKGKADRPWKSNWDRQYSTSFPKGLNFLAWKSEESSLFFNPGILTNLNTFRPQVVLVGGYNHFTMWMAMIWAFFKKIPFLLMSETRGIRTSRVKDSLIKKILLRWIARHSAGALPTGHLAENYLLKNGWNEPTLLLFPNVPDIVKLKSTVEKLRQRTSDLRKKWELQDEKLILYVGRLIRKKHVNTIVQAFSELNVPFRVKLVIVGNGDQAQRLQEQCRQLGIKDQVRFLGFLEPPEILEWLSLSDVFALASNETWGVAPIEAAAAGLRLLLSSEIGVASELEVIYPRAKVIPTREVKTWRQAMADCLNKKTTETTQTVDNNGLSHWHFDALTKGLYVHLSQLS